MDMTIALVKSKRNSRTIQNHQSRTPLVSLIIPTYNRSWALEKPIRSVFEDTYRPIECIVVDDGSTDDTATVIKYLQKECPKGIELRYIQKENGGANSARNRGLVECTGEFICFLDSDDYLINDAINERVTVLINEPEIDFCYGNSSTRDEARNETGRMGLPWPRKGEARISKYLFHTNSPMMRRSIFEKVGYWREDDLQGQEHEYFARLKFFAKKVTFIDKDLSVYVKHEGDHILNASKKFALALFRILICIKGLILYTEFDIKNEKDQLSAEFRHVAKWLFRAKDYKNAGKALEESLLLKKNIKVFAQLIIIKILRTGQLLSGM